MDLAKGPLRKVKTFPVYYVNGYKFHTEQHGSDRATMNSGVCIKGSNHSATETDYYGVLMEVVQLEYPALPIKRTVLFKCKWFDLTKNIGTRIHEQYKLVDVHHKRSLRKYEPFIMAGQAEQVYYTTYPSVRKNPSDWWAVSKIKARAVVEVPEPSLSTSISTVIAFQEDVVEMHAIEILADDEPQRLIAEDNNYIDIDDMDNEEDDEPEIEIESEEDEEDDQFDDSDNE